MCAQDWREGTLALHIPRNPRLPSAVTVQATFATCLGDHPPLHVPLTVELRVTPNVLSFPTCAPFPATPGEPSQVPSCQGGSCSSCSDREGTEPRGRKRRRRENAALAINFVREATAAAVEGNAANRNRNATLGYLSEHVCDSAHA